LEEVLGVGVWRSCGAFESCRFDGLVGLRDASKRDSSTSQADCFAGAKQKKKRRLSPVGMTISWLVGGYQKRKKRHSILLGGAF
jgi:hypothetical protein